MDAELSLSQQHVPPLATLEIQCREDTADLIIENLQIFVRGITGNTGSFMISTRETIWDLKQKISQKWGLNPDSQSLVFASFNLHNDLLIAKSRITNDCTLHLSLRLRSGMLQETSGRNNFEQIGTIKKKYYLIVGNKKIKLNIRLVAVSKICSVMGCSDFQIIEY